MKTGGKIRMDDEKKTAGSLRSIFTHANALDKCLMAFGLIGAIGDGFSTPVVLFVSSRLMEEIGTSSSSDSNVFLDNINKNSLVLLYVASALLFITFLGRHCMRSVLNRMRAWHFASRAKAGCVSYSSFHVTSASEVITSLSSGSLVLQDVLVEKL